MLQNCAHASCRDPHTWTAGNPTELWDENFEVSAEKLGKAFVLASLAFVFKESNQTFWSSVAEPPEQRSYIICKMDINLKATTPLPSSHPSPTD